MYSDRYGEFVGHLDERGNVAVSHAWGGAPATQLDAPVFPILYVNGMTKFSPLDARHEYAGGIILAPEDAGVLGITVTA